jgi:hypothetical protein
MCCLRYEHDFYVQQRKRFPKEGKVVTTTKGQEKVLVNDIFRERVTLRGEDGETRILALADLRVEMGGVGVGERIQEPTGEEEAFASPLEGISEEVIRLQDTVELPAWVPRSPDSPRQSTSRQLPVAPTEPVGRPKGAEATSSASESDDAEDDEAGRESTDTTDAGARPERRRRRRGRRGGRRNRGPDRGTGERHDQPPGTSQDRGDGGGKPGSEDKAGDH